MGFIGFCNYRVIRVIYSTKGVKKNKRTEARIEWIQKVRETTAETAALYFSLLHEEDTEKALEILIKAQQKIELFILYFGPDKSQNGDAKKESKNFLLKKSDNAGKNDVLVDFLKMMMDDFKRCYEVKKGG